MEILYILVPISVILITLAITLFGWAIKNGQYDDLEGPGHSILFDDDEDMIPKHDDVPPRKNAPPSSAKQDL
jgi:cbb3-type cytochrome oxidase maturation protein